MNQKESFGIMDDCYFTPKGEIIDWVNNLLQLNITKIEQFGSGAVYCQIVDAIHPGKITMNKVNWRAKNDYEFIQNLKILQSAFEKLGVKRYVEVEKLARAKYQDNLEFIQWLKKYFETNGGCRGDYDANERRGNCQVDFSFAEKIVVPKSYNGSGQIIGNSKTEIPVKKSTNIVPTNRVALVETKAMNKREQSNSPQRMGKKEENKGGKYGGNLEAKYKNEVEKNNEFSKRFEMILEVLNSGESASSKVNMIEEIVNFQPTYGNQQSNQMEEEENVI